MTIPLSTITRIEEAIVDRILSSRELPPAVLVQRLADSIDKTGTVTYSSVVTVRYNGMSASLRNRVPLVTENTLNFEIEIQSQEYFSHHGHDAALRIVGAIRNVLTNFMPMDTGILFEHPLNFVNESFRGITENTEFVYVMNFNIVAQFTWPLVANDPCVQRGDSRSKWPDEWAIDLPNHCAVDPETREIYCTTNDFPCNGKLSLVSISPPIIRCDGDGSTTTDVEPLGKKLIEIQLMMFRSPVGSTGSVSESKLFYTHQFRDFSWIYALTLVPVSAYLDPLHSNEIWKTYSENILVKINPKVSLTIGDVEYVLAEFSDSPLVWIQNDFILENPQ